MAYPDTPSLSTSYTAKEQAIGDGSFPGQELDIDFEALRTAYIELLNFVKGITRSDGKLANGSVGAETLGAGITLGFEPPSEWETATAYSTGQTVFEADVFYICVTNHTSTIFADDLSSGRWDKLVDFTTQTAAAQAAQLAAEVAQTAAETAAETARTGAETARTGAETARTDAQTARTGAETAQTAAETARTGSETARTGAETARSGAETAQTGAETARTGAETAETNAAASATAAATFDPANFYTKAEADAEFYDKTEADGRYMPVSGSAPAFVLENRQASGVGGGTINAGSVNTMVLNTKVRDDAGIVTLASNEFTVTEDCYIEYAFPIYSSSNAAMWLYNVTDGVVVPENEQYGMNSFTRESTVNVQVSSNGWALLEANHTYRIELDSTGGHGTTGQGNASVYGGNERYGHVKGWLR